MIQRIQTVWLLISAISSWFLMRGEIINFISKTGEKYFTGFSGIFKLTNSGQDLIRSSVPLTFLIILIPVVSIISIMMFRSRRIQKIFTLTLIIIALCLIMLVTYYSLILIKDYEARFIPGVKMFIPPVILIVSILAYKGIVKDERLVKSYDRLR